MNKVTSFEIGVIKIGVIILLIIMVSILSFILGIREGVTLQRKEAISAGVAHYTVNPTNGVSRFEFKY
jgi:hypothetical protein